MAAPDFSGVLAMLPTEASALSAVAQSLYNMFKSLPEDMQKVLAQPFLQDSAAVAAQSATIRQQVDGLDALWNQPPAPAPVTPQPAPPPSATPSAATPPLPSGPAPSTATPAPPPVSPPSPASPPVPAPPPAAAPPAGGGSVPAGTVPGTSSGTGGT